jgi:hypothetical protein
VTPQPDWRESLEQLKAELPTPRELGVEERAEFDALQRFYERGFLFAASEMIDGRPGPMIAYLRTGRASREEQADIGDILAGEYRRPFGRPPDKTLRRATGEAEHYFTRLKRINRERGVKDRGHRDEMRAAVAELAAERCGVPEMTERILDRMRRPLSRRKS